jgi:hypothetical protein
MVVTAWLTYLLTGQYADRLQEMWGPTPDVVDALGRDRFVSRHTLPYLTAVVVLDGVAVICLLVRNRRRWPMVLAAILLVPGCGLHGLAWFVTGLFEA